MGGNALQNVRRHDLNEYSEKVSAVKSTLRYLFPEGLYYELKAYYLKDSFGDADILCVGLPQNYKETLIKYFVFDKDEYVSNGNVFSINFNNLQVDLISTPLDEFESSKFYFDFNDFGNLIGKITRKLGMKFGHDGLFLRVYDPEQNHTLGDDILLTRKPKIILEMLGLSYHRYEEGFMNLEDMFEFVASSPYFNPGIYLFENLSNKAMVRDHKRKTYNAFVEWVDLNKSRLPAFPYEDLVNKGGYRLKEPFYSDIILKYFPEVDDIVKSMIKTYEENQIIKSRFNGDIVKELLGIEGKDLGLFMKWMNSEEIKEKVRDAFLTDNIDHNACIIFMYDYYIYRGL